MDSFQRLQAAVDAISPRFTSGNSVPIQKAQVPIDEWAEVISAMNDMRTAWSWAQNPERMGR